MEDRVRDQVDFHPHSIVTQKDRHMTESDLLRCLIQVVGRVAVPQQEVREIVGPKKKSRIKAFNLCDGSNSRESQRSTKET